VLWGAVRQFDRLVSIVFSSRDFQTRHSCAA
jgi:hypothetical protein